MYKILDSPQRMSRKQIKEEFSGKWVFLVDTDGPLYGWFETAVPAVVADEPFEGDETGIYDEFIDKYGCRTTDWSLLHNEINVFGFSEVIINDE